MDITEAVKADILNRLGFIPPFFEPALSSPAILHELWRQTVAAYLDNPLPMLFKEKLAALLGRYCSVPYCLICHSATLRPLGMSAAEVLKLLEGEPIDIEDSTERAHLFDPITLSQWPPPGSLLEKFLLDCSVSIFLKENSDYHHQSLLRLLGRDLYSFLVLFIAYNRVCFTWAEAHPELSYEADRRYIENLGTMLEEEPALGTFFAEYRTRAQSQADRRFRWLTRENKRLVVEERKLRLAAEDDGSQKKALLDSVEEGIYCVDVRGKCVFSNLAARRMLRKPTEALVNQAAFVSSAPTSQLSPHQILALRSIERSESQYEPDTAITRQDGSSFPAEIKAVPTFVQERCTGAVVSFRDITAAKQAHNRQTLEKALLKRQNERLRDLFYQTPAPICILEGPDHVYTLANRTYTNLTGHRELIGKTVRAAFPELADTNVYDLLHDVFTTGKPYAAFEELFRLGHGPASTAHYLDFIFQPLYGPTNKVENILVVAHDVTNQVLSRKAVEASESKFRLMTEAMPQLVWLTDAEGQCIFLNHRYERFVGKKANDLASLVWRDLIHPDDRASMQMCWDHAVTTSTDYQTEYRLRDKDDTYRWMLSRATAVRDEKGVVRQWLGTCTDVDEQKRTLDELSRERDVRDRFVAAMTHDLRSPLTAAKMRAELCLRRSANEESVRASVAKIIKQVQRADSMIQDLLDANSLRFGKGLPIKEDDCDIADIIRSTVDDLADIHHERVLVTLPEDAVCGFWDGNALRRALENLITNAVKYGDAGQPIKVAVESDAVGIVISVHNEGPALSEKEQKVIFNPFERTSGAKSGMQKGWGLGLSLVRGVAEAHGGAAAVDSAEGKGTTFMITIPRTHQKDKATLA